MPQPDAPPLIGITGRRKAAGAIAGFPDTLGTLDIDLFLADYGRDVRAAGGLPVLLPVSADVADYGAHLDGLVLTGGADVTPGRYGAEPDGRGSYEPERDAQELALFEMALAANVPVLGVCRGLQVINVATGGTLHQDVPPHSRYDDPSGTVHPVSFGEGTRLGGLYGPRIEVNSLHHQAVDGVGSGLAVTARADDGTVEGLEMEGRDVVAVQWHPELRPTTEPVFDWLVAAAASHRSSGGT